MPLSGSEEFIDFLLSLTFSSSTDSLDIMEGCCVNGNALTSNGFKKPVLIPFKDGLRIKVPSELTPRELLVYIDPSTVVDVIDVRAQSDEQMTLREIIDHFYLRPRVKLLNMLSLEFSRTEFSKFVEPPHVVSELSLISTCWIPEVNDEDQESAFVIPSVQKYCLLSMAGSYTDFHIDFGGSSVWYHVMWGEKIFYLIPPTADNFSTYWNWLRSPECRSTFLPDLLSQGQSDSGSGLSHVSQLHLSSGQTILLPAGWIHAVYTVSDCLVFGGNFLNELHIPMQLSVYKLEQKAGTPQKFQFPNFEKVHWFASDRLVGKLTNALYDRRAPPLHELDAACSLVRFLPRWLKVRENLPPDERHYYLPSPDTMELSYTQLIERLFSLIAYFIPSNRFPFPSPRKRICSFRTTSKHRTKEANVDVNSGAHIASNSDAIHSLGSSSSKGRCNPYVCGQSSSGSSPRRALEGGLDWTHPERKLKRRSNDLHENLKEPVREDPDIIEALPELSNSLLIGDHYYLFLSDSDDEESASSPCKRGRVDSEKSFLRKKARDPDPTWTTSCPAIRCKPRSALLKSPNRLLSSSSSKNHRIPISSIKSGLHPLLRDANRPDEKNFAEPPAIGCSQPSRPTKTKKQSPTTARQRLAKRLGL